MSSKKIFVVIGATGAQGGAIAHHILKASLPDITLRAITRTPSSPAAKDLASLGAEVVQADLNDRSSLERAFHNATYIFLVTNYFETLSASTEITQGVTAIDAACTTALSTLQSFIWSSAPDPRTFPSPFQHVVHRNTKAEISKHLRETPLWDVSTEIWVSSYFQDYFKFRETCGPQRHDDGSFVVTLPVKPTTQIHGTDVNTLGPLVAHIISDPLQHHAETIVLFTQALTPVEQMKIWANHVGVKAEFHPMTPEDYFTYMTEFHGFPNVLARDMAETFACADANPEMWTKRYGLNDHDPHYDHDSHITKATDILGKDFKDWESWVKETDWTNVLEDKHD